MFLKISPQTYSYYTVNQKMTQELRLTSSYHVIEEFLDLPVFGRVSFQLLSVHNKLLPVLQVSVCLNEQNKGSDLH